MQKVEEPAAKGVVIKRSGMRRLMRWFSVGVAIMFFRSDYALIFRRSFGLINWSFFFFWRHPPRDEEHPDAQKKPPMQHKPCNT